jgi:cytochrome c oxidase assembly protein subunit 15
VNEAAVKGDRLVSNWILLLAAMVFGMVAGGGHARTIGAGFALQVWQPVTGFIPPLTTAAWQHLFVLFQQTAQYQARPVAMGQFKALVWPMFIDRDWGRLMALVFLLPLIWFTATRRISARLAAWLVAIFAMGAAQAAFGWLIVVSGRHAGVLTPPPALAAPHFLSAMLILGALLWTGLSLRRPAPPPVPAAGLVPWVTASLLLIFVTMGFGALVATTGAIAIYHSFPLMDGQVLPGAAWALHPALANFILNPAMVQFCHRGLASLTALTVLGTAIAGLRADLPDGLRDNFLVLAGLVALQYLLGMATIVLGNQTMGYVHELNGVLLFAACVGARHGLRGAVKAPMLSSSLPAQGQTAHE